MRSTSGLHHINAITGPTDGPGFAVDEATAARERERSQSRAEIASSELDERVAHWSFALQKTLAQSDRLQALRMARPAEGLFAEKE